MFTGLNSSIFVHAGQYLYEAIKSSPPVNVVVDFVWNRSFDKIKHLPKEEILENLDELDKRYFGPFDSKFRCL